MIIYSGNNFFYYFYELVYLYIYYLVLKDLYLWVGEGIVIFYGGKLGYDLYWYLLKLKIFLEENFDFDLLDIVVLKMDIFNGDNVFDLCYVIGGLLMRNIY